MNDKKFWENIKDYDNEIISVFSAETKLNKYLADIKSKEKKIICDIGCGIGNSFEYIKEFKHIYAVDYSRNMLNKAKEKAKELKITNITFIESTIEEIELKRKCDVLLAISSIFPKSLNDFRKKINNLKSITKKKGLIIITLPSFEALTLRLQFQADFLSNKGLQPKEIYLKIRELERKINYSSFGVIKSRTPQKYWLKEEMLYRLKEFNFAKISIEKLKLDWERQVKLKQLKEYPKFWLWLIRIKN